MLKTKEYIESQNFQPDIVLIKLGTNDTKPQNWKYKDEFMGDLFFIGHFIIDKLLG